MNQRGFVLSAEARQQIIQTFLEIEREITTSSERSVRNFPFGRLNGYKQALTLLFGPVIVKTLHDEAYGLHLAEFVNGKYVAS